MDACFPAEAGQLRLAASSRAGAQDTRLPLLRGPVVSTSVTAAPSALPAPPSAQLALTQSSAFSGDGSAGTPTWQSQGAGPPSPAAAAAHAALRRCARAPAMGHRSVSP